MSLIGEGCELAREACGELVRAALQHVMRIEKVFFVQPIPRVDHRRNCLRSLAHPLEDLSLLHETQILQFRIIILFDIGRDHFGRIANQKTIR